MISSVSISGVLDVLILLVSILITVIAHEAVHLIILRLIGIKNIEVRPTMIGFIPAVTINIHDRIPRRKFLVVSLSPLLLLSLFMIALSLIVNDRLILTMISTIFAMNITGSAGDIIISLLVLSSSKDSLLYDKEGKLIIYGEWRDISRYLKRSIRLIFIFVLIYLIANFKVEVVVE